MSLEHVALLVCFVLSLTALAVAVGRRRSAVTANLQAELDLAVEQNRRLVLELAQVRDELHHAKLTSESLEVHARVGVAYANQVGGTPQQKFAHALGASILSDKGTNGVQDWPESLHRIAIEAELHRLKTRST